ncbi:Symplekin [Amphibalanus amphitrite]|uniref:Symplekin n=1 Tax=Amphibalanus amphitrite TaxID=1232801 RepID=A0A6A4VYY6_AMPAM|nr:Symplekin [Amphibalanus amphitrite]
MVPKVVANLSLLLQDSFSVAVVKRTIQAIGNIYKITLQWLSQARSVTDLMDSAWSMLGQMKRQIISYVDHDNDGGAHEWPHRNICTLLTDLGASQSEVARAMPPAEELRKRQRRTEEPPGAADDDTPGTKRQKFVPEDDDDDDEEVPAGRVASGARLAPVDKMKHKLNAIDITETWAAERLTPQLAADLVLVSMQHLPDAPPALFSNTFTPISAAGTRSQIQHVARLLAAQLTKAGLGPGVEATRNQGIQMTDVSTQLHGDVLGSVWTGGVVGKLTLFYVEVKKGTHQSVEY